MVGAGNMSIARRGPMAAMSSSPGAVFGPETFVERVGDDALAPLVAAGGFT